MIGNHAIPVMADAYRKGFIGFDAEQALQEMVKSSTENHFNSNWTLLNQYGYYPFDSLDNEAVSRTLEHGVDDAALAQMAESMGKKEIAEQFRNAQPIIKTCTTPLPVKCAEKTARGIGAVLLIRSWPLRL